MTCSVRGVEVAAPSNDVGPEAGIAAWIRLSFALLTGSLVIDTSCAWLSLLSTFKVEAGPSSTATPSAPATTAVGVELVCWMLFTTAAGVEDSAAEVAAANLDSRFEIAAATEAVVVEVATVGCCHRL